MKNPTPQQTRWLSYISEFNCTISNISGAQNLVVDALSRLVSVVSADFNENLAVEKEKYSEVQKFFRSTTQASVETEYGQHKIICNHLLLQFLPKPLRY